MKKLLLPILLATAMLATACAASTPPASESAAQPAEPSEPAQPAEPAAQSDAAAPGETSEPAALPDSWSPPIELQHYSDSEGMSFTFTANTLDGETVDESIFADYEVTMINVWGTYCGPCLMEMPDLGRLSKDYADKGVQVLGVICDVRDLDENAKETARGIVADTGADYKHLTLNQELIQNMLSGVQFVPTTFFVDSTGKLLCAPIVSANSYSSWAGALDELLAK